MNLKNKIVVITGGSKGFGKALALGFLEDESKVIISSNNKNDLKDTANEINSDYFFADVTVKEDLKKLSQYVLEKYGRIDIWINNAGIQIAPSVVEEVDIKKLHNLFDINLFGYFYGCQVALSVMKKQEDGLIININSTAGLSGKPGISAYSASKFAIKGLTESVREEVKNTPVKIYAVFPGGMQTEIYKEKYPEDINDYMKVDTVVEKVLNNLKQENPEEDLVIKRPTL